MSYSGEQSILERLKALRQYQEAQTFAKFAVVGILSNILNFIVFLVCVGFDIDYFAAAIAGYLVGLLNSFVLGYKFVFAKQAAESKRPLALVALLFLLVYGAGALIMGAGVDVLITSVGLVPVVAWLLVAAVVVVWNYVLSKRFVF